MKKLILFLGLATVIPVITFADDDHQESRRLMEQGEILPLQQILDRLGQERTGHVLEVELEYESAGYIYEIELLGDEGRVWEYEINAATGEIINRKLEK